MSITLGRSSYIIQPYHILSYDSRLKDDGRITSVNVGNFTSIAFNCTFVLSHHCTDCVTSSASPDMEWAHGQGNKSSFSRGDINIGSDVWIGANVTIMDGLSVGTGAVIAAGAVVTRSVAPYEVVGGNPARFIKSRFDATTIERLLATRWWERPFEELRSKGVFKHGNVDAFLEGFDHATAADGSTTNDPDGPTANPVV